MGLFLIENCQVYIILQYAGVHFYLNKVSIFARRLKIRLNAKNWLNNTETLTYDMAFHN